MFTYMSCRVSKNLILSGIQILIQKCPDVFCYKNVQNIKFLGKKYAKSMKNDEILKISELLQEICPGS